MCTGVLRGCVRWGVEGNVCSGVEGMCALGVLRGMCVLVVLRGCVHWGVEGMCALGC